MNQVDAVADMVSPFCGSVSGRARKRDNGQCLASGVLSRRKLSPSIHPVARQFSFSPHVTGVPQAAAPMLELRGSDSV